VGYVQCLRNTWGIEAFWNCQDKQKEFYACYERERVRARRHGRENVIE
jgi:hypothetical protein